MTSHSSPASGVAPANGRMFGIFSQYNDSELVFTEFMEITQ